MAIRLNGTGGHDHEMPPGRRNRAAAIPCRPHRPDPSCQTRSAVLLRAGRQGTPPMTTTRDLCRALGAALQVPGVARHAARLVRDGYLPRAGDEVDEADAVPTFAARRQRRFRERRRRGVFVVSVEVTCAMAQALVDQGDVDEANSNDPNYVGKAITAAARRGLDLT